MKNPPFDNRLIITHAQSTEAADFNLEVTMDSGQVFGFVKQGGAVYRGDIGGQNISFYRKNNRLFWDQCISEKTLRRYFDLDRDLSPVYRALKADPKLVAAYNSLRGLRLIQQDPWQGLAGFILSSNNNVKRIQRIWSAMIEYYSTKRKSGVMGFPSAREIADTHENTLRQLGLGYRAPFLWASSVFVANNPQCFEYIREESYERALEKVLCFPGIGPKVADCVLLYAFQKYEAFPVDVWILKIVRRLYFNNRKVSEDRVRSFAQARWGEHAGYIQQYLFHGARTGILG